MDTVQNNSQIEVSAILGCYTVLIGTNQHCVTSQNSRDLNLTIVLDSVHHLESFIPKCFGNRVCFRGFMPSGM